LIVNMRARELLQLMVAFLPFGKRLAYRSLFGARIADGVRIGFGAVLLFDELELLRGVSIAPLTYVRARNVSIGVRSSVGRFTQISVHSIALGASVTISPQVSIKGDPDDPRSRFTVGAECWVFEYCYINVARPVTLGRNVGVGGGTYIFSHGYWLSLLHGYPVAYGDVTIGNDVWLPWGCFILPGVEIGEGAVIGARSVVNRNVPAFALVAGSPAKIIRDKVTVDVTVEQRVDILIAGTREFCAARRAALEVEGDDEWVVLRIAGAPQVAIAKKCGADHSRESVGRLLRVVHEPLKAIGVSHGPLYSTASFQCTPRQTFNDVQSAWLAHLRKIGTRHYPVDEVQVE
jgi:acetyltransferase-like isoleucine patch superfamily enzyme